MCVFDILKSPAFSLAEIKKTISQSEKVIVCWFLYSLFHIVVIVLISQAGLKKLAATEVKRSKVLHLLMHALNHLSFFQAKSAADASHINTQSMPKFYLLCALCLCRPRKKRKERINSKTKQKQHWMAETKLNSLVLSPTNSTADSTHSTGWMAAKEQISAKLQIVCRLQTLNNGPVMVDSRLAGSRGGVLSMDIGHTWSKWVALYHFTYLNWAKWARIMLK